MSPIQTLPIFFFFFFFFFFATIDSVYVGRYDEYNRAVLTITATASMGNLEKSAVQVISVSGEPFTGTQFAILANNISCILCHIEVRSIDLENNLDPDLYGTFDRVKVASLESLLVRKKENVESNIAGTVYTLGMFTMNPAGCTAKMDSQAPDFTVMNLTRMMVSSRRMAAAI